MTCADPADTTTGDSATPMIVGPMTLLICPIEGPWKLSTASHDW
jgi:hypothetical protein